VAGFLKYVRQSCDSLASAGCVKLAAYLAMSLIAEAATTAWSGRSVMNHSDVDLVGLASSWTVCPLMSGTRSKRQIVKDWFLL